MNKYVNRILDISNIKKQKTVTKLNIPFKQPRFDITFYFPTEHMWINFNEFAKSNNTTVSKLFRSFIKQINDGSINEYLLYLINLNEKYERHNWINKIYKIKTFGIVYKEFKEKFQAVCAQNKIAMNRLMMLFVWDTIENR